MEEVLADLGSRAELASRPINRVRAQNSASLSRLTDDLQLRCWCRLYECTSKTAELSSDPCKLRTDDLSFPSATIPLTPTSSLLQKCFLRLDNRTKSTDWQSEKELSIKKSMSCIYVVRRGLGYVRRNDGVRGVVRNAG